MEGEQMQQKHDFQIKPSDNEFLSVFTSYINSTHTYTVPMVYN